MYVCMYVCMYAYIYIYIHLYLPLSLSIYIYVCIYTYVCMYLYIYIYIYIYIHIHTSVADDGAAYILHPISLLGLSMLRFVDSKPPGNSLRIMRVPPLTIKILLESNPLQSYAWKTTMLCRVAPTRRRIVSCHPLRQQTRRRRRRHRHRNKHRNRVG